MMDIQKDILDTLQFHIGVGRPLSALELKRATGDRYALGDVVRALSHLAHQGVIEEHQGFYVFSDGSADVRLRIGQDVVADTKWRKFVELAEHFQHIPFVDLVFGAGSMALGNVKPLSDFDVLIGARHGRIFTVRFFTVIYFGMLRKRRKKMTHHDNANNMICLNHFVTEKAYTLTPPYNQYWKQLYRHIVPLYGEKEKLEDFIARNEWADASYHEDLRHVTACSRRRIFLERILSGGLGDIVERILRSYQLNRIERGLRGEGSGVKPRILYGDDELEFHPDTARIEEMVRMR